MKLVIQRVKRADVNSGGRAVGEIKTGLFVLIGIKKGDTKAAADYLASKLLKIRIMPDEVGKLNKNVVEAGASLLLVSQFTLNANTNDGNRPSFIQAEEPKKAKALYNYFIDKIKMSELHVATGSFGQYMQINAVLDGPVTIIMEI